MKKPTAISLRGHQRDGINAALKSGGDFHAALQETCEQVLTAGHPKPPNKTAIEIEAELVTEKKRRIYYQQIVYDVCNRLDRAAGKSTTAGTGIVCGTIESPSRETQTFLEALVADRDKLRTELGL